MAENTIRKEDISSVDSRGGNKGENQVREAISEFETSGHPQGEVEVASLQQKGGLLKGANTVRKRNVLGRGLSALMSTEAVPVSPGQSTARPFIGGSEQREPSSRNLASSQSASVESEPHEGGLVFLNLDRVLPNRQQPREHFSEAEIERLAQSIRDTGLLQPIIVRKTGAQSGPLASYEIVAGERRFRAAKIAELSRIPAILRQLSDREALELGIIENVQRENLNPIEEARAFSRLISDFGASQEEVAESVGKDRASIANALRLLKLPESIQQQLIHSKLSAGHGRALLMFDSLEAQLDAANAAENGGISVRALEALAKASKTSPEKEGGSLVSKPGSEPKAPEILELEERLRRAFSTKVSLRINKRGKGELRVSFFSQEELERIIEKVL